MRNIGFAGLAIATLLALGGCGAAEGSGPGAGDQGSSSTPQTTRPALGTATSGDAPDDPFHLTAADWPVDLTGAKAFYAGMPAAFRTWPAKHPRYFGPSTGVTYGSSRTGASAWSMEAGNDVPDAHAALAVMFGMTMICDKGSYQGTAEPMQGGLMPGYGSAEGDNPWWFSCQVRATEGSPGYRAHAVGWTSGDLGWLVMSPDDQASHELVDIMVARTQE